MLLQNPFRQLRKREWALWLSSLAMVIFSNLWTGTVDPVMLLATMVGVTALIFVARGDVWGQILTVVFSFLYAVAAWRFRYWGEMITYLGMSMPIALLSVITWLRHPYEKGKNEVKIARMRAKDKWVMWLLALLTTLLFYFLLRDLDTPNLLPSTLSVTTSFLASWLMMKRNSCYALAYAANDAVLIALWVLACFSSLAYLPMVVNFALFLVNDLYGFISWKKREKKQRI